MDELYICYFGYDFKNVYLKSLDEIKEHISKCKDTFTINTYSLVLDDLSKKREDISYLSDKSFSFLPNGIEILVPLEDFWNDIKNYIPKSVTRLELPSSFIERDTMFLSNFPNLETIVISDYGRLYPHEIKIIADNTSVRTIYYKSNDLGINSYASDKGFCVLGSPYSCCLYGNTLYCNINEPDIDKKLKGYFKPSVNIHGYDLDVFPIERLYSYADDRLKDKIVVDTNDCRYSLIIDKDKGGYQIQVVSDNVLDVNRIVDYLTNKGISVSKLTWKMRDNNYYDKDISSLESISKQTELCINYGDLKDASYEDFKGLLESVKWYRKIINDGNLTPVEKVMFAFDILKTFRYKESDIDEDDSRYAHRVIETGNIVCVGYSNLLIQILKYIDKNIAVTEFGLSCYGKDNNYLGGHSRSLVKIDDDKYNIHGIFALDATWDSDKSHKFTEGLVNNYTSLDLYRYFLIPAKDYEKTFPGDTLPGLFDCYLGYKFDDLSAMEEYIKLFDKDYNGNYLNSDESSQNENNHFKRPFDDKNYLDNVNEINDTDQELKRYLSVGRPSLKQFSEMLVNVRMAEGYTKEDAVLDVERVIRLNKKFIEIMNADGKDIEFFKEDKGVSR